MDETSKKWSKTADDKKEKNPKAKDISVNKTPLPTLPTVLKKKRKRETVTEVPSPELEIDISLPTPPSKKALRQQKKVSTTDTPDTTHPDRRSLLKKLPARAEHCVWIGNLAYTTDVKSLRGFLVRGPDRVSDREITRINLPLNADGQSKG
jgi:hypothetical protein